MSGAEIDPRIAEIRELQQELKTDADRLADSLRGQSVAPDEERVRRAIDIMDGFIGLEWDDAWEWAGPFDSMLDAAPWIVAGWFPTTANKAELWFGTVEAATETLNARGISKEGFEEAVCCNITFPVSMEAWARDGTKVLRLIELLMQREPKTDGAP